MGKEPWWDWEIKFLRENYHLLTYEEIVQKLGRSGGAIRQKAYKLGLKKFQQDVSFFEQLNSNASYIVGLFAADGYAQSRKGRGAEVTITQKHRQILDDVREIIGQGSIYHIRQHDTYRYSIYGRRLYNRLCLIFGHDIQKKSRILQWPEIPGEYTRDFIRGFCDGDGHISLDKRGTPQIRFYCGSIDFRDRLMSEIEEYAGIVGTISVGIGEVYLALYCGIKAICLAKWLYNDCELALQRKKDKAVEIASLRRRYNNASVTPKMKEMFPGILARKVNNT